MPNLIRAKTNKLLSVENRPHRPVRVLLDVSQGDVVGLQIDAIKDGHVTLSNPGCSSLTKHNPEISRLRDIQ
jgi:hypothetical protein